MTIKALLLGSAAAMAVVSGAQAADAVVIPEPEAVEYVRVCDAAGAGYFYIPGGETCIKIGGYVQFEIKTQKDEDSFNYTTESVLNVNTYTDSDFGAVKTYIKIQGGGKNSDYNTQGPDSDYGIRMDRATLSIGGLTMGWTNNFMDFADGAGAADDRQFGKGYDEANQIKYVANFSGGSFGVQLVDDANGNYTPDILAMGTFSAAGADFKVVGVYDDESSAWTAKAQAGYMGFGAIVQYSSAWSKYAGSNQWVIGANYGFDATEKLNLNIGASYGFSDSIINPVNTWTVGAEAKYKLTDTFTVSARARVMEDSKWDARVRFKASF